MEISNALSALAALAHETRLLVFKKLVEYGYGGVNAGDLARELGIKPNTLSFHLSHLENAGLVKSCRYGRNIKYNFDRSQMNALIGFLNENCCTREENGDCLIQNKIC